MSSTTRENVKRLYYRPYPQRFAENVDLPRNDIRLSIYSGSMTGARVQAECMCSICKHRESYKPQGPRIPDGKSVMMDQRIQKCVHHFQKRGFRRVGDAVVCKECRVFCEQFDDRRDMLAKRTQLILEEIMEWGKDGVTFKMVTERWRDDDARQRGLADFWCGRRKL